MSVHQYIGARYVPYYYENSLDPTSTEWEPNVHYEALTVVTLSNGHSYISKKDVPDTIGTPASNAEYWLDTGSDNAYIQNLQDQIDIINNTDLPAIDNRLDNLESQIGGGDGDILIVFDSYGTTAGNTPGDTTTIPAVMQTLTSRNIRSVVASACGFVNNLGGGTFESFTQTYLAGLTTAEKEGITSVIVAAGRNDWIANKATLKSAVQSFYDMCKLELPNASQLAFGYIANGDDGRGLSTHSTKIQQYDCYMNFKEICEELQINWLSNVDCVLHNYTSYLSSDGEHPTESGKVELAYAILEAAGKGYMCSMREQRAYLTACTGRTIVQEYDHWYSKMINNIASLNPGFMLYITLGETIDQASENFDLFTISGGYIQHPYSQQRLPILVCYEDSTGLTELVGATCYLDYDGVVHCKVYAPSALRAKNISNLVLIADGTLTLQGADG